MAKFQPGDMVLVTYRGNDRSWEDPESFLGIVVNGPSRKGRMPREGFTCVARVLIIKHGSRTGVDSHEIYGRSGNIRNENIQLLGKDDLYDLIYRIGTDAILRQEMLR